MILTSFYRMKNDHGQKLDRFSIDVLKPGHVSAILKELSIKNRDIYTYSYLREEAINIEKITDYHKNLWKQGKIDYVLTSIAEVQHSLSNSAIPTYLMAIPKRNMLEAIEQAKSTIRFNHSIS